MKSIIIYNKINGEVLRNISCPDLMVNNQIKNGEDYIIGNCDDTTCFIDVVSKNIINKTEIPVSINKTDIIADDVDTIIISNLPASSIITVTDIGSYTINDGTDVFEFSIDSPGEYTIICSAFPYLDKEFIINAS